MASDEIVRTDDEIREVIVWAYDGKLQGGHYRRKKYEDGLIEMFDWLTDRNAIPIIDKPSGEAEGR